MIISHNEIVVACLKAFEALGMPKGQREDAAESIGWLALHGLPFEQDLKMALAHIQPDVLSAEPITQSEAASSWDANGASALAIFPNLADYAVVRAQSAGEHQLLVSNCVDIALMWPYLEKLVDGENHLTCRWSTTEGLEMLVDFSHDDGRLYQLHNQSNLSPNQVELFAGNKQNKKSELLGEVMRVETSQDWADQKLKQTQDGIRIGAELWQNLMALGKGILVESTAESERRGAGGV